MTLQKENRLTGDDKLFYFQIFNFSNFGYENQEFKNGLLFSIINKKESPQSHFQILNTPDSNEPKNFNKTFYKRQAGVKILTKTREICLENGFSPLSFVIHLNFLSFLHLQIICSGSERILKIYIMALAQKESETRGKFLIPLEPTRPLHSILQFFEPENPSISILSVSKP